MPTDPLLAYLNAVRERCDAVEAVSPGPWRRVGEFGKWIHATKWEIAEVIAFEVHPQADFITAARTDVDRMERMLRVAVGYLRDIGIGLPARGAARVALDELRRIAEGEG